MARPPAIEQETALWLALNIRSLHLTDDQFLRFCSDNDEFEFEVSAEQELVIMSHTTPKTELRNAKITMLLGVWAEQDGTGVFFGSSAIFTLPNGAKRAPDGSWISNARWNRFSEQEKDSITRVCPDFVIELRSTSNRLSKLKEKMDEYIANGAQLAWLLDPMGNCAVIYRPGQVPQQIDNPAVLVGDPVLPGFKFNFREIV